MKFFKTLVLLLLITIALSRRSRHRCSRKSRSHTGIFKILEKYGEPSVRMLHPVQSTNYPFPAPEHSHKVKLVRKEGLPTLCIKFVTPYDYSDKYFFDNIHQMFAHLGDNIFCLGKNKVAKVSKGHDDMTVKIGVYIDGGYETIDYDLKFDADPKASKPLNTLIQKELTKITNLDDIKLKIQKGVHNVIQSQRQQEASVKN
jgi:hypothetical protein